MPREKITMACAMALLSLLILTAMPLGAVAATSTVLLQEDAEESTYDEWNVRWQRFDLNKDVTDGAINEDFWCRSAHNLRDSAHAIYASRNGYNSHYLVPITMPDGSTSHTQAWNVNVTGLPGTTPQSQWVPRYDTNQDSIMKKAVVGASAYSAVTLTFWFWSDTGASDAKQPLSGTTVGYDFLNVIYWTDQNDASTKRVLWTDTELQATAGTWIQATVDVPNDVDAIGFEFVSGSAAPAGGDADNAFASSGVQIKNGGMREGVYLDDIVLTGSDASATIPVSTSVDNLAEVQGERTFNVGFTRNEPTVPFDHVNLYYRQGSSGDWIRYGSEFTTSPISFTAASDGRYEFFTQGFDANGGEEEFAYSPDAATVVDTVNPVTTIDVRGTAAGDGAYAGSASFTLSATDAGSGVNATFYRVDSSSWIRYSGEVAITNGGSHQVQYYSTDLAGNIESSGTRTVTIQTANPVVSFPEPGKEFNSSTATVRFEVSSETPIAELRASMDGAANSTVDSSLRSITFTGLSEGVHRITVWARDDANRWGQNMTVFTVKIAQQAGDAPSDASISLVLGSLNPSYSVGDVVRLSWTCDVTGAEIDHFAVLVDDGLIATLGGNATGYDLTGLTAGVHKISVVVVDDNDLTLNKSVVLTIKAGSASQEPGSGISQDMIIIGGVALFGVLAAVLIIFLRSRRMY